MSLNKYEVFTSVMETGSLTKAGELLGLTQSAVSHAIASLEQEFGLTLMIRGRSGISLTSNGERLYGYMREILRVNEQMKQEVDAIKGIESGTVNLGTFTSVSTQWLPGILKQFQDAYPNIEIKLFEGYYDDIEEWVSAGKVDLGFVSMPTATSFDLLPLKKDRMLLLVPSDHPLAAREIVQVSELVEETFIMPTIGCDNDIQRILKEYKLQPKIKYELGDDHAIIAMVQNGLGISILPEMILFRLPANICVIPLEGAHYRTIGIGAPSMANLSPAAQRFLACVEDWVRNCALPS
ncbi:LysR family transcriptional regulator [Brevibacillus invocatus]|uniref:LysR family transcriptional regulator n=1 Tax=Brevibacillus invocatus TaxID=173959 RepID=A0A3M8C937_9BACL|nr:LysR family transcriptional regulator [Brevibacillus invocatus]MCM3079878.1 LysR family transcriptional regulator [Brevibacillus invocatus]MCM3430071.1 LysR family transcriptional regulator [Brevibacillus invocatus]RNB72222.1 LysR family transcriptional regulator [Brevibacillus invocatus]